MITKSGLLLCAKYAVAPNFFGYCGPDDNKNIVGHLKDNQSDKELAHLISDFETLYPYLQLIARENQIDSPFDERVVEAYWLGNRLLEKVSGGDYLNFLEEKLQLGKRLDTEKFIKIKSKISSARFLPNHAFHVFNIFKRTGKDTSVQTIKTMDECRIGWGKIVQSSPLRPVQRNFEGQAKLKVQSDSSKLKNIFVEAKELVKKDNFLKLSNPLLRKINIDYQGKQFITDFKVGDWVSFHWGMICDKLTATQVKNLEYYTKRAIDIYNN